MQVTDTGHLFIAYIRSKFSRKTHLSNVLRGARSVFFVKIAGLALAYVSQIFVARWLGQAEFGIYAYAWTWLKVLAAFATMGLDQTALRFIPQYMAKQNWAGAAGMIRYGRVLIAVGATGLAVATALVVFFMQGHIAPHYVKPLWLAFAMVPLLALIFMHRDIARAFGLVSLAYIPRMVALPFMTIAAVQILMVYNATASALTMLSATLVLLSFIMLAQSVTLNRSIPGDIKHAQATHEYKLWLRVSAPLLIMVGFRVGLTHTSLLMCGAWLEPEDIAVFFAAERVSELVGFVLVAVNALGAPKIAFLHTQKKHTELQRLVGGLVRWSFWPSLVITGLLILCSDIILGMFGPAYVSGKWLLSILVMGNLVSASVGPVGYLLVMTDHQDSAAWLFGGCAVVNILLNAILIPAYGLFGAAYAMTICVMLRNIIAFFMVKDFTGIHSFVFFQRRPGIFRNSSES